MESLSRYVDYKKSQECLGAYLRQQKLVAIFYFFFIAQRFR